MAVLEFKYDGSTKAITAVEDCELSFSLYGAGGGGGGNDSHAGSYGISGGTVHGKIVLQKDQTVYCTVGQGGHTGASGRGSAQGGYLYGHARDGFSGGQGSNAGPAGSSGAGGQGGGATVLAWTPPKINGQNNSNLTPDDEQDLIAVASGGGGGGGGGHRGSAYGEIWAYFSWGSVSPFLKKYYNNAATNGAYCSFLNTYGVWNGDTRTVGRMVYNVYFPVDGTYKFTMSADNYAYVWIDNGTVNGNDDFVGNTDNGSASAYNSTFNFDHYIAKGWHTVDVYSYNYGGPAGVAVAISEPNQTRYMWTTRSHYNRIDKEHRGRGGMGTYKGGDGGGAGGGGGGWPGGSGGYLKSGDQGGYSGSKGYDWWAPNDVVILDSAITSPTGSTFGAGGANTDNGASGGALFEGNLALIKVCDVRNNRQVWDSVKKIYRRNSINIFGWRYVYWTPIQELSIRDNGVWKRVAGPSEPTWYSTAVGQTTNHTGPRPTV